MFYNMFSRESIKIISGIVGTVDEVIDAFINGRLDDPAFRMPGSTLIISPHKRKAKKDKAG